MSFSPFHRVFHFIPKSRILYASHAAFLELYVDQAAFLSHTSFSPSHRVFQFIPKLRVYRPLTPYDLLSLSFNTRWQISAIFCRSPLSSGACATAPRGNGGTVASGSSGWAPCGPSPVAPGCSDPRSRLGSWRFGRIRSPGKINADKNEDILHSCRVF